MSSPSDERAKALHALSERVAAVVVNVPYIRQTLEGARFFPGIPIETLNALAEVLKVLAEVESACAQAVLQFDRLRRVI